MLMKIDQIRDGNNTEVVKSWYFKTAFFMYRQPMSSAVSFKFSLKEKSHSEVQRCFESIVITGIVCTHLNQSFQSKLNIFSGGRQRYGWHLNRIKWRVPSRLVIR